MGWLQQLVKTYDGCAGAEQFTKDPLQPISHTPQQTHIEIVLDAKGFFQSARIIGKQEDKREISIPATAASAGRSGKNPSPHPLCDKIQYIASDYATKGGGKPALHVEYLKLLAAWCESPYAHHKAQAVLNYVRRGTVINDLVKEKLLHLDADGKLLTKWRSEDKKPKIFELLPLKDGAQDQGGAIVRWHVAIHNDRQPAVWLDPELQSAWIAFNATLIQGKGLCMATGQANVVLTTNHPKRIRHSADQAKLISANDKSGFTFRGRFTDDSGDQACGIGYDASQKAHLALRWLIGRQAFRNDDQVVVSWAVNGEGIPDPLADTFTLFGLESASVEAVYRGDAGQSYALALKQKIAGYRNRLSPSANVIVMALDAATPGRMAVTFYREFGGAEFLDRVEAWHERFGWHQNFGKERKFTGAPAPRDIAEAAYGQRVDERLRKACVERLLPCIVDGYPLPRDLMETATRRASNRIGLKQQKKDPGGLWGQWEKCLGIACALFKGHYWERNYKMALEQERTSRDYLYGRLLALAEKIEGHALYLAKEERDTTAARLMQRFSDHPHSTWRNIELALLPYKSRLRSRSPGYLHKLEQQIDQIVVQFSTGDFIDDRKLTGEFLLGYHCQRAKLNEPKNTIPSETNAETKTEETT
jgi:CRISPR-associated protein Csd1